MSDIRKKAFAVLILTSLFVQITAPITVFADESVPEVSPAPLAQEVSVPETPTETSPDSVSAVQNTDTTQLPVSSNTESLPTTTSTEPLQNTVGESVQATTSNQSVASSTSESFVETNTPVYATTTEPVATSTPQVETNTPIDAQVSTTTEEEAVRRASPQAESPLPVAAPQKEVISEAKFFAPKPVVVPVPAFINNVSVNSTTSINGLFSRVVVTSNGLSHGADEIVAPAGTKYAVIKAWGASGGSFGNDNYSNSTFAVDGVGTLNARGGFGGYVSGVVEINGNEKLVVSPGFGGYSGYRKHDDNDIWGFPGASTTVSFRGKEILVAGAGAPLANGALSLDGTTRVYINNKVDPTQDEKIFEDLRNEFANGGSIASKSSSAYLADSDGWYKKLSLATTKLGIPMWPLEGGDGLVKGSWKFKEVAGKYIVGGLTGGSSYVDSSVIKPVLYSGDPARNSYDEGAWNAYLKSVSPAPAQSVALTNRSGGGAVIVEFWASLPNTPDGPTDPVTSSVALNVTLGGVSINASSTVPVGSNPVFSWSFSNVSSSAVCSLVKTSVGGTSFSAVNAISPSTPVTTIQTGALVPGSYAYLFSCGGGVESSVSFTVPQTISVPIFNTVLTASPSVLGTGATSTLVWVTSNADSCVASLGSGNWSGPKPVSGSFVVGPISSNTTYTITCNGKTGSTSSSVVITFSNGGSTSTAPIFTVPLTASVNPVTSTGSTTLVWSSINTASCVGTLGANGWAGMKPSAGTFNLSGLNATTIFAIDCGGANGTTTSSLILGFTPDVVVPVAPVNPVVPTTGGRGGGGGGGPCVGHGCPTSVVTTNVVATTTDILIYIDTPVTTPDTTKSCPAQDFITQYLKVGINNNPNEVRKLKYFLNTYEKASLTVNGDFDSATEEAVKAFQEKYSEDILAPWNTTVPTGIVYITTKAHINKIFCRENPDFRSDDDIKDILVDDVFKNNTVNPDDFKGDIGLNTATSTASSSVPLQDSGNLASAFFALGKVLKDISWYTLFVLFLLIVGCGRILYASYIKDKNKPFAKRVLVQGAVVFGLGLALSVFNSLSFMIAPLWLLSVLGIGIASVVVLDTFALICILLLFVILLILVSKEETGATVEISN